MPSALANSVTHQTALTSSTRHRRAVMLGNDKRDKHAGVDVNHGQFREARQGLSTPDCPIGSAALAALSSAAKAGRRHSAARIAWVPSGVTWACTVNASHSPS